MHNTLGPMLACAAALPCFTIFSPKGPPGVGGSQADGHRGLLCWAGAEVACGGVEVRTGRALELIQGHGGVSDGGLGTVRGVGRAAQGAAKP